MPTSTALDPLLAALDQVSLIQREKEAASPTPLATLAERVQAMSTALGNPISAELAHQAVARLQDPSTESAKSELTLGWDRPSQFQAWKDDQQKAKDDQVMHAAAAETASRTAIRWRVGGMCLAFAGAATVGMALTQPYWWMATVSLFLLGAGSFLPGRSADRRALRHKQDRDTAQQRQFDLREMSDISLDEVQKWAKVPGVLPDLYRILVSGVPFLRKDEELLNERYSEELQASWARQNDQKRQKTYQAIQGFVAQALEQTA